ncbi:MAG: 6,7-dimethyl-8-ribityllumazine synthase [Rhodoplanes sp.]|uniref:6,7-dimethyl-8-ribityllumazine synthase n=1 Tax=Rhodoplanes sp. TaxID=1968906 RepID=UPI0017C7EAE3|nr:6,7-dimethyl-8-ribityllumazine synthase [Rhodoplanes sp.]NVO13549.1 6,7-dimethyl-8-ribityllumazine synthase [Rhodoplanes sp.]
MAGPSTAPRIAEDPLPGARILIVEARYYGTIADALLEGARRVLDAAQVEWDIVSVPGSLEVPQAVAIALEAPVHARRLPFDGIVALGCVIRGETSHYDIVAGESARALMDLAIRHRVPIGNGIVTTDTHAQALARANPEEGDKGGVAAAAVTSLIRVKRHLQSPRGDR